MILHLVINATKRKRAQKLVVPFQHALSFADPVGFRFRQVFGMGRHGGPRNPQNQHAPPAQQPVHLEEKSAGLGDVFQHIDAQHDVHRCGNIGHGADMHMSEGVMPVALGDEFLGEIGQIHQMGRAEPPGHIKGLGRRSAADVGKDQRTDRLA